jgi:hypothetical protein
VGSCSEKTRGYATTGVLFWGVDDITGVILCNLVMSESSLKGEFF